MMSVAKDAPATFQKGHQKTKRSEWLEQSEGTQCVTG